MKKAKKPDGIHIEAFAFRRRIIEKEYHNKCRGDIGKQFKRRYPSAHHYLYAINTFWFYHDLLMTTEAQRKQINYVKHWEIFGMVDDAIAACARRHELSGEIEEVKKLKDADHFIIEVSRDTFKSTAALAGLIRVLGVYPDWNSAYIRSKAEDAYDGIRFVTSHLLNNGELHKFFPNLKIDRREIKRKQLQFSRKAIGLPVDETITEEVEYAIKRTYSPEPNLEAIGLDVVYTGKHKNGIVVVDDAVTEKNYASKPIQDRMWGRLAEMSNVASWQACFIYDQTPYSDFDVFQRKKAVLQKLQEEEDKNKLGVRIYKHYRQPLLELKDEHGNFIDEEKLLRFILHPANKIEREIGEKAIVFPERHNPRTIRRKYAESPSPRFFYSQYLLKMIPETDRVFKDEWLVFYGENTPVGRQPAREDLRIICIIDPSGGSLDVKSDEVGIIAAGVDSSKIIWLLEAVQKRMTSKGLMDMICGIYDMYRPDEWYMEAFGAENKYRNLIQQIVNYGGYKIAISPIKGKATAGAKYDRIEGSSIAFEMHRIYVHERHSDFLKQYAEWRRPTPAGMPDHLLDGIGYLTQMIFPSGKGVQRDIKGRFAGTYLNSAFDLSSFMVKSLKEKRIKKSKHEKALCPSCFKMKPASLVVCDECGIELWIGVESQSKHVEVA